MEIAKAEAKKGLDAARRGNVAKAVIDDIKVGQPASNNKCKSILSNGQSLFNTVEASYKRAERDNDLIYHQVVPSSTSLPVIPDMKDVVSATVPLGLSEPKLVVGEEDAILADLSGWGVLKAIGICRFQFICLKYVTFIRHLQYQEERLATVGDISTGEGPRCCCPNVTRLGCLN